MKFDVIVGNPPYQGQNHRQIYPQFYVWAKQNCDQMSMIFPTGWQEPKNKNGLQIMNNPDVKCDKQIVSIDNIINGFKGVAGAKNTNIVYWKKGYDNGLNGKQLVYTDGKNPVEQTFSVFRKDEEKPIEILELGDIIESSSKFNSMENEISPTQAYKLRSEVFKYPSKYDLPEMNNNRISDDDIKIYGISDRKWIQKYVPHNYPLKRKWKGFSKFKVYVPEAWGGCNGKYLGGSYGSIILAKPYEISTESFLENGCFDDIETAKKHAKYILSKFTRALIFIYKYNQHTSKRFWKSVPVQDYTEDFWNTDDIDKIDEGLFDKYNVPEDIRDYVRKNIQPKTVKDILGYDGKDIDDSHK